MTTRYVCGFAFPAMLDRVILIEKQRPAWQKGLFNGVGGHIEDGEMPVDAMVREFHEETGVLVPSLQWRCFALLNGYSQGEDNWDYQVSFFSAGLTGPEFMAADSMTDEEVLRIDLSEVYSGRLPVIPNIRMLISMALDDSGLTLPVALSQHH